MCSIAGQIPPSLLLIPKCLSDNFCRPQSTGHLRGQNKRLGIVRCAKRADGLGLYFFNLKVDRQGAVLFAYGGGNKFGLPGFRFGFFLDRKGLCFGCHANGFGFFLRFEQLGFGLQLDHALIALGFGNNVATFAVGIELQALGGSSLLVKFDVGYFRTRHFHTPNFRRF